MMQIQRPYYNLTSINDFVDLYKSSDDTKEVNILNKNVCFTKNSQKYSVIRYNKSILPKEAATTYGMFRSVVLNCDNKVVSFAPPKTVDADDFMNKYKGEDQDNNIVAEEFVEGTMINVFWDPTIGLNGSWEITTRNTVGAESGFYKSKNSKTFKEMFLEAIAATGLNINELDKELCYSFVLQHPENRIVVPFNYPALYLVAVYRIVNNVDGTVFVYPFDNTEIKACVNWYSTNLFFPAVYQHFSSYADMIERYASKNTDYKCMGIIFKNLKTGERCKVRNPNYEEVRKLRGNQPKSQYQYLSLRSSGSVGKFLTFFPEYKGEFNEYKSQVHSFTIILYQNYVSCYIKKEKPLHEFSEQFRTHMFNIHQLYLNDLKEKKQHVTNSVVINYVNHLHPTLLMHSLNQNLKKHQIDIMKAKEVNQVPSHNVM